MHAKIDGSLFEEKSLFWDSYIISLSLSLYIYIYIYINMVAGKVTQRQV